MSVDAGKSWTIIARVLKPATTPTDGATAVEPTVERGGRDGIAIAIGGRRLIRILPDLPANYKNGSAIVVDLVRGEALFKELVPANGATVRQIVNNKPRALSPDYIPQDRDVVLITCPITSPPSEGLLDVVKRIGEQYKATVLARVKAQGKRPTSGILSLSVNLVPGETASALTYFLDGEVLAIQNQLPYSLKLDTRRWSNGEHVLEARAVDANGAILTQKKTLLYVENGP